MAEKDREHLRMLSIFHYVLGAFAVLFTSPFIIHIVIGIIMLISPESMAGKDSANPPPPFVGWMFTVMGGVAVLGGWTLAVCLVCAGRFLVRQKHYLFCLIIAGLSCLCAPLGTVLGVFTIIVLLRPSVKELFVQSKQLKSPTNQNT
ncbi:MAG: hypothetical protein JSW40_03185 [Candidatus Omnitrophota bacterium]|nr:MAG: hypothetical protein JSW40_03185 [Candidatus Omnitrophota bacterium]